MRSIVCILTFLGSGLALPSSKPLIPIPLLVEPLKAHATADIPGTRIIGGHEVVPNSVPYQVAVLVNGFGLCGGSLISTTAVLSAAHCTIPASFVELRLGAHYHSGNEPMLVRVTSTSFINHERFNAAAFANDISIVVLPSPVSFNSAIQAVPLAPSSASDYVGSPAYITGWGMINDGSLSLFLRGVNVTIMTNAECAEYYNVITDEHICTSGTSSTGDAVGSCSSDSGGPLVVDGIQVGIVAFGTSACTARYPSAFVRISAYRDWIREKSGV